MMGGACSCWTRLEERADSGGGGAADAAGTEGDVVVPKQLSLNKEKKKLEIS
jgi:hypothetical protein